MTDLDTLWLATLQEIVGRAAHEVKDALNGVHLNLEALRSRSGRAGASMTDIAGFVTSAAEQMESLSARTESLLFLTRSHSTASGPADVAVTLKHLATLLVPATRADGGTLAVEGYQRLAPTAAPAQATRLALAAGLLGLTKDKGAGRCRLDAAAETVVRFSHESAGTWSLDPAVARAVAKHQIRTERSGPDLLIVFPGT